MKIEDKDIVEAEKLLLPKDCHFSEEVREVIRCMESKEILACPGSGKTTLLLAKLYILSKNMPFENNQGICVLSHTNVAVDEIKNKLGDSAKILLSYPNYVGTIQSFVDKFVSFPYISGFTKNKVYVVSDEKYAKYMWELCNQGYKYIGFKYLVSNQVQRSNKYNNEISYIKDLYLNLENGKLYLKGIKKCQASQTKYIDQFRYIKNDLLKDGLIKYNDAYMLAQKVIDKYGTLLTNLLSKRFKYVFIDEYQDCDKSQCKIINKLFDKDKIIVQKIGDVDQAIYSNEKSEESPWIVSENALKLPGTNRYHQKIADELVKLRTNNEEILSFNNNCEIKPVLIVYEKDKIEKVIDTFANIIKDKHLPDLVPNGTYKAIGMIKNGKGITIENYWNGFNKKKIDSNSLILDDYVQFINQFMAVGDLGNIEKVIRKMLCQVCFIANIKTDKNKYYTEQSIKIDLNELEQFDYKTVITNISKLDTNEIKANLVNLLKMIFNEDDMKLLSDFISNEHEIEQINLKKVNSWIDYDKSLEIDFDTVYGAKGETHTATLYLETETTRKSDLKRIMPLFRGEKIKNKSSLYEKSRKVAYVGMSRPTHLLCVAMQSKTYKGNEEAFKNWDIKLL